MIATTCLEGYKMARYAASFLKRELVHVNLQIHYACNFKCRICDFWHNSYQTKPGLSVEQVEVLSDKLSQIGPQIISIGGGEPLLHPDIEKIVHVLAQKHFPVMICNGWFVTPQKARRLFEAGLYEISVSVDYADPQKHDRQRGVLDAYLRAINALETLHQNRTRSSQRVHMISVIMDDNLQEIEPLIQLCAKMGITYLVTLYSNVRGTKTKQAFDLSIADKLMALRKQYPNFVALQGYLRKFDQAIFRKDAGLCRAGKNLCNIDSQGDVSLCIDRVADTLGNLLREDMQTIRKKLILKYHQNTCRSCWTSCRGSIETLMYGGGWLNNLQDYYQMAKPIPLHSHFS